MVKIQAMQKHTWNNDYGFTLVEVMIAMTILAIGILGVSMMQISAVRGNSLANGTTEAVTIAQDRMERFITAAFDDPDLDDKNGDGDGGLDRPSRVDVLNGGNRLLDAGGADQPDYAVQVNPSTGRSYFVYWNVTPGPGLDAKTIRVIAAWNSNKGMQRMTLDYIKNN
jgi:prepilin-type N-terminal cleavage/methylation domain-containing protein